MKVTAVLLKYKRLNELQEIMRDLSQYEFIDEILVHDNRSVNVIVYGRYAAAARAQNEIVYVQDEDCIVGNIREMYETFIASGGDRMVNGMKAERLSAYQGRDTMVGWGAFIRREWVSCLDLYVKKFGEDRILYREADRIFTRLLEVPRLTVRADVRDYPSATSSDCLSFQANHETSKAIALGRCAMIEKEKVAA